MQQGLALNFILSICRDKIPGFGEDNYCYCFSETAGLLAVFDGLGGAGARTHKCYDGKSEAYVASRLVAGAFYDAFQQTEPEQMRQPEVVKEILCTCASDRLKAYAPQTEVGDCIVRGSLIRTLPTTVAAAVVSKSRENQPAVTALWAGDSRVYLLDEDGLAQLTVDDTTEPDPMETLYEDGVLKKVACLEQGVRLRSVTVCPRTPFILFAATDGCFGYVSTPMEFEALVLRTLLHAKSVAEWEENLANAIGTVAGDDYTFCLAAFGYPDFETLQDSVTKRLAGLDEDCLRHLAGLPLVDRGTRRQLWNGYKDNYFRYLRG